MACADEAIFVFHGGGFCNRADTWERGGSVPGRDGNDAQWLLRLGICTVRTWIHARQQLPLSRGHVVLIVVGRVVLLFWRGGLV